MEGASFGAHCGMLAQLPSQPPRNSPYRIFKILIPVWLVLLVVAAGIGWGSGMLDAAAHSEDLEGTHAGLAVERYGQPQAFWLTDGPGTPGEKDYVRLEQWFYPEQGVILNFYDGRLMSEEQMTFSEEQPVTSVSPTSLSRWMRRTDVEGMLGESGTPLEGVQSPYPDLEVFAYPRGHLLVGYLDDRFFSAQSY